MKVFEKLRYFIKGDAFKSAGIYTFSNFFGKAVGFLLVFIYSNPKYISVDENGLLNLLNSSTLILMPFLSMGIVQSTSVDFFKLNKEDFRDFLTSGFVMPLIVMLLSFAGLYLFKDKLESGYNFPASFVFVIPVITFFSFCNEQFVSLIRNNDEPFTFFKASMLRLFLEIGISITLVVAFAWRWQGRVTGMIAAQFTLAIVAYLYFKKKGYLFGKIKKNYLKAELLYALPMIVMQCSIFCLSSSDKFFLSYFSDNKIVGIYGYACIFAAIVTIGCSALLNYVMPKIYSALSQPVVNYTKVRKYLKFYALVSFSILVIVVAITPVLYKYFINNSYYPGLKYIYIIGMGYFFWGITSFFYSFMLYNKQKAKIVLLSVFSICISFTSNYFFIKNWGLPGAALSVLISYFIVLIVTLLASAKDVKFLYSANKMAVIK